MVSCKLVHLFVLIPVSQVQRRSIVKRQSNGDRQFSVFRIGQTEISVINFRKELAVLTTKDPETDICPLQREFDVSFIKK